LLEPGRANENVAGRLGCAFSPPAGLRLRSGRSELELPFWLAVTQLEHAEWLARAGRLSEAEALLSSAGQAFASLRARPWIERAARLRDSGSGRALPASA
jgi:hypothetical protein